MSAVTYHLLTEAEPFSEFTGGAISRWAGNILHGKSQSVVVCASADESWGLARKSIHQLSAMMTYKRVRRRLQHLPWQLHRRVIQRMVRPLICLVRPGDIVWIHNRPEFAVAMTPLIHSAGGRVVLHLHNSHLVKGPEQLMRQIQVDRLVFVSSFLHSQAWNKFPNLGICSVVHNGADPSIFYPASGPARTSGKTTVLFAGRLVEEKGVHVLLDAMRLLEKQKVPLQAHIVGSAHFGPERETGYTRGLKASKPANVEFLPYCSGASLGDLFRQADIFCSPSIWDEPFGLVNVEALACALPVVSTNSGGAREIFAHGGGILVERGSAIQLASALRRLAEDRELRTQLGEQGYASFLQRFTWAHARRQVEQIEQDLCA